MTVAPSSVRPSLLLVACLTATWVAGEGVPELELNRDAIARLCAGEQADGEAKAQLLRALGTGSLAPDDALWGQVVEKLRSILRPADRAELAERIKGLTETETLDANPYLLAGLLSVFGTVATPEDLKLLNQCLALKNDKTRDAALRAMVDLGTEEATAVVREHTKVMGFSLALTLARSYYPPAVGNLLNLYGSYQRSRLRDPTQKRAEIADISSYFEEADPRAVAGVAAGLLTGTDHITWDFAESWLRKRLKPDNVLELLPLTKHKSEAAFLRALDLVFAFADDRARESLGAEAIARMAEDRGLRARGLTILGRTGQGKALISEALSDTDRSVAIAACRAAADSGEPAFAEELAGLLQHEHFDVRMEACDALGILKAEKAVTKLQTTFRNGPDLFVKDAAARALTRITGKEVKLADHPVVQARAKANATMPERRAPKPNCPTLGLIPEPQEVVIREGEFEVNERGCAVVLEKGAGDPDKTAAMTFVADVKQHCGFLLPVVETDEAAGRKGIFITSLKGSPRASALADGLGMKWDPRLGDQGYLLTVTPETVVIRAAGEAGRYYGTCTLLQLLRKAGDDRHVFPALEIVDWPTLEFRGFMGSYKIPGMTEDQSLRLLSRFKFNLCRGTGSGLAHRYHIHDLPEAPCGGHCGPPILGLPTSMWEAFGGGEPGPCPVAFGMHEAMGEAIRAKIAASPSPYWFARADETACGTDPRSRRFTDPSSPAFKGGKRFQDKPDAKPEIDRFGWIWSYHWAKNVIEPTRELNKVVVLWSDTVALSQDTFVQFIDKKDVLLVPWSYGGDGSGRTRRWQAYGMMDRVIGMPTLGTGGTGVMHPGNLGNGFEFTQNLSRNGAAGVWQSLWADYVPGSLVVPWIATAHLGWSFGRNPQTKQEFTKGFLSLASERIFGDPEVFALACQILECRTRLPNLSDKQGQAQFTRAIAQRFAGRAGRKGFAYSDGLFRKGFADLLKQRGQLATAAEKLKAKRTWEETLKDLYCCEAERRLLEVGHWLVFARALVDFDKLLLAYEAEHKRSLLEPPAQAAADEEELVGDELDEAVHEADATEEALEEIRKALVAHVERHGQIEKWSSKHRFPKPKEAGSPIMFYEGLVKEVGSAIEAYRTQKFVPENTFSRCVQLGN